MKNVKRTRIALNLPQVVTALIVYGRHVVLAMTGNPWFPSPNPPLPQVTADLDALEAANIVAQGRAKGAVSAREQKQVAVENDLLGLQAYAEGIALQHPEQSVAIIESGGMSPRQFLRRPKPPLSAHMGVAPDEVILTAKAARRGSAYEWQYSLDGGRTWIAAGTTTVSSTRIAGFTPGAACLFRFRTTLGRETGGWSQPLAFIVH
jgi:hypothetical protein